MERRAARRWDTHGCSWWVRSKNSDTRERLRIDSDNEPETLKLKERSWEVTSGGRHPKRNTPKRQQGKQSSVRHRQDLEGPLVDSEDNCHRCKLDFKEHRLVQVLRHAANPLTQLGVHSESRRAVLGPAMVPTSYEGHHGRLGTLLALAAFLVQKKVERLQESARRRAHLCSGAEEGERDLPWDVHG